MFTRVTLVSRRPCGLSIEPAENDQKVKRAPIVGAVIKAANGTTRCDAGVKHIARWKADCRPDL
jgi:hypothetical protein